MNLLEDFLCPLGFVEAGGGKDSLEPEDVFLPDFNDKRPQSLKIVNLSFFRNSGSPAAGTILSSFSFAPVCFYVKKRKQPR
jgi:hypothetical protein